MSLPSVGAGQSPHLRASGSGEELLLLSASGSKPPTVESLKKQIKDAEKKISDKEHEAFKLSIKSLNFTIVRQALKGAYSVTLGLGIATIPLIPVGCMLIILSFAYDDTSKMVKQEIKNIDSKTKEYENEIKRLKTELNELNELNELLKAAVIAQREANRQAYNQL